MAKHYIFKVFLITFTTVVINACATVAHGPNTGFVVQTLPSGALVITDRIHPKSKQKSKDGKTAYYGCESTPCTIKMPRKSDFNVLIIKEGYQPSTHVVTKDHRALIASAKKASTELGNSTLGAALPTALIVDLELTAAAEFGTSIFATTSGVIAASGLIVAGAIPFYGAASGIDLATGASTDIMPNPLTVKLIPETTPEETTALIDAFFRTRNMNAKNTAALTK